MKLLYSLLFCSLIFSFINTTPKEHEQRTTSLNKTVDKVIEKDSIDYWVSTDYLRSLDSATSICDCWRNNKFHFLRYDTVKMELFLKSNLLHYGHDSEFTLPLIKTKNGFQYDSTVNDWKAPFKEITILSNDSLLLLYDRHEILFIKKSIYVNSRKNKENYYIFNDLFYKTNSQLLLKYSKTEDDKSDTTLIAPETLHDLIRRGYVNAHCSDDFYLDGITIKKDSTRYFELQFNNDEISLFELKHGRNRREKFDYDTIPKQVILIE